MTLQLVDGSIRLTMGIIDDVLGMDDEFIFSIDFVIQDVDKDVEVPFF